MSKTRIHIDRVILPAGMKTDAAALERAIEREVARQFKAVPAVASERAIGTVSTRVREPASITGADGLGTHIGRTIVERGVR